jgi:hypothetical protein
VLRLRCLSHIISGLVDGSLSRSGFDGELSRTALRPGGQVPLAPDRGFTPFPDASEVYDRWREDFRCKKCYLPLQTAF